MITSFARFAVVGLSLAIGSPEMPQLFRPDNLIPKTMHISPDPVTPGTGTSITVLLDSTAAVDTTVYIAPASPSYFSSYPSSVVVPAGTGGKTFNVTIASTAPSGWTTVTASCNGGSVTGAVNIG